MGLGKEQTVNVSVSNIGSTNGFVFVRLDMKGTEKVEIYDYEISDPSEEGADSWTQVDASDLLEGQMLFVYGDASKILP